MTATTATLVSHRPCRACGDLRLGLIRLNRALAWAIVISPPLQIALGVRFLHGLLFDVALVLVHGGLSLALFGLPRDRGPVEKSLLITTGLGARARAPRNKLLLSGYRVFLGLVYAIACLVALRFAPPIGTILACFGMYAMLRLPFSSLGHLYYASEYAARRVGVRDNAAGAALLVTALFVMLSLANLFKG